MKNDNGFFLDLIGQVLEADDTPINKIEAILFILTNYDNNKINEIMKITNTTDTNFLIFCKIVLTKKDVSDDNKIHCILRYLAKADGNFDKIREIINK